MSSIANTTKKVIYHTEEPDKAVKFLNQIRAKVPIIMKNDKGELIQLNRVEDVVVSIIVHGEVIKKEPLDLTLNIPTKEG